MTAAELPPNLQEFNEITAVIFSQLYLTFPIPRAMHPEFAAHMLGLPDQRHEMSSARTFEKVFAQTLKWLVDEGFVRGEGLVGIDGVVLTTKGLAAMNVVPPSLSRPLGSELADATEQASTEAGKRKLTELIGELFGSALGSFTKNISGG
jgi:hypothetical protein